MDLREKINHRLDTLQEMLENNEHLDKPQAAEALIHRISPFWSILSEEDRDSYNVLSMQSKTESNGVSHD